MFARRRLYVLSVCLLAAFPPSLPAADGPLSDSFFVEQLYPILHAAQCVRCHSGNGVASETELQFPPTGTAPAELAAFGLSLRDLVDTKNPAQSPLLLKPTKRIDHTGGQRIKPGSDEEKLLLAWINHLASLSQQPSRATAGLAAGATAGRAPAATATGRSSARPAMKVRRLTHSQYDRTVRDLLGDQIQPAGNFPKEDFISGFKNQVEGQGISPLQAEAYGKAAERLAAAAFRGGDQRGLLPLQPSSPADAASADQFVRRFGLNAFRRPLTDGEVEQYSQLLLAEAARSQDFLAGATLVVEAMLQSPHFLFRIERGGAAANYDVASRLSYFLWDTLPDAELFVAASRGELSTEGQVEAAARRMLADPRAKEALDEFLSQWLRFDSVLSATRDRRRFRDFNGEIAASMVEETRRLFQHLVFTNQNFLDFLTADYTFVSSDLARLYGLPAPSEEFAKVEYPEGSGRSGVLGHGSFLVSTSKPAETSPTARGLFVRNHFLGHEVPPPPPGVDTTLPAVTENAPLTNRQRLDLHLNNESCAGCHRLIDPIGLAFEPYNAIGVFQPKMSLQFSSRGDESRRRQPTMIELDLDTSGYIQGLENSNFTTPKELGRLLASSSACQKCIVKQLFRYAFGREETPADQPTLEDLLAKFRASGYRFQELIIALVTSDLFLKS